MFRNLLFAAAVVCSAPAALAAPIGIDGFDPVITLGFNPQPEPPPLFDFTLSEVVNGFDVVAQVSGVEPTPFDPNPFSGILPTPFRLSLEISEGAFFPPEPIAPVNNMFEVMLRTGGETLRLVFTVFFPDGTPLRLGVVTEAPGGTSQSKAIFFPIINQDFQVPEAVAVKMQVLSGDVPLGLSEVPLPAPALLLGATLLALGVLRRRA